MFFKEIIAVYSENHKKLISTFCGQNADLLTVKAAYILLPLDLKGLSNVILKK
jgi:hypothetical protein